MAERPITVNFLGDTSKLGNAISGIGGKFSGLKVAAGAAAAGAGAAISAGIANTISAEAATKKLQAQLGGANELSRTAGEAAGRLYAGAYGENLEQVNEAVRSVIDSGAVMEGATSEQLQSITGKAMSLSQAFNQDVGGTMRAVGQMIRTGLAPDAESALDIITRGFQQGNDKAGDMLDTLNEYGTQFRKLGIDGTQAMGLIQQGLKAGARDADVVADSIKEFSIRAVDGSKLTADGFKAIGLDVGDMAKKIGAGGASANQALDTVIDRLRGMKDPVAQSQAAIALFGTQAEDLGKALFALDPSSAVAAMGDVAGAAQRLDATIGDTAQAKITSMQRSWESWTMSLVAADGPMGTAAAGVLAFGDSTLGIAGNLAMVTVAMGPFAGRVVAMALGFATSTGRMLLSGAAWAGGLALQGAAAAGSVAMATGRMIASGAVWAATTSAQAASSAAAMAVSVARMVAGWTLLGAQSLIRAAQVAAAWFIAMGPIGWAIAAVVGIVALIIANWDKVKAFTVAAWNAISDAVSGAISGILGFFGRLPGRILGALGNLGSLLWNAGSSIVSGLWNGISAKGSWLKSKIIGFIKSFVPGPVLQYLGIASASKLFAGIGREIPAGVAQGVVANANRVRDAVLRMSGIAAAAMSGTSIATASTRGATAAVGGLSGGNAQLTITGGADQAIATLIMTLIREGKLQLSV